MSFAKFENPIVSIIIATYNRPEMLKVCIKGVLHQTIENWKLYVIGDCCSETTKLVVTEFYDKRIIYYNNPFRFGEQGGGNSLGIALSDTKYIAFLNHDDIWLPNHLEVALKALNDHHTNFYIGRSAVSSEIRNNIPIINEVSNNDIKPFWTFTSHFTHFEPCSTWVICSAFAKKIGYWNQSRHLHRRPIQDYILRAWKKGANFKFGKQITCVQIAYHNNLDKNVYSFIDHDSYYFLKIAENKDLFYSMISENKVPSRKYTKNYRDGANRTKKTAYHLIHDLFVNKITAYFYYYTGIDSFNILSNFLFFEKGKASKKTLNRRTGETDFTKYFMEDAIEIARINFKNRHELT